MAYNLLITKQGGWLHLDEMLPSPPLSAEITIERQDERASSNGAIPSTVDEFCVLDDLVLTLPTRTAPWRTIAPMTTEGTIGDLTETRRRFILQRGGRKAYLVVSEFDEDAGDVTTLRFDEGIDFSTKEGDTLSGLRCSYYMDLQDVEFVGRVKANWKVECAEGFFRYTYIYDVMRQEIGQPASWSDVLRMRPDADNELSQVMNKEIFVTQAWEEVSRDLLNMGIRHNLIIPNGSTLLRDAVVYKTLLNLVMFQNLSVPSSFLGQGEDFMMHMERNISKALGQLAMPVDEDEDGEILANGQSQHRRQVWFRGRRAQRNA